MKSLFIVTVGVLGLAGYLVLRDESRPSRYSRSSASRNDEAEQPEPTKPKPAIVPGTRKRQYEKRNTTPPAKDAATPELVLPVYEEDVRIPRVPRPSDLKAGSNELDVLRKFGEPDLRVATSGRDGTYVENFIYRTAITDRTTSVVLEDGRVVASAANYPSRSLHTISKAGALK